MSNLYRIALASLAPHRSALLLGYLALTGVFSILSVEAYLGSRLPFGLAVATIGLIFGIYLLNLFTDVEEDFTNDHSRQIVMDKRGFYLTLLVISLGGTLTLLAMLGKLHAFHIGVVVLGGAYSFQILPWRKQDGTWEFRRLKDVTLVKNLIVAGLWGAFMVVMPVLYAGESPAGLHALGYLGGGFFLAAFCNTLFADILDLPGDRIAGIPTLPVKFGTRFCYTLIAFLGSAWLIFLGLSYAQGWIDGLHAAVLSIPALYPFTYVFNHRRAPDRKGLTHVLMETDLVVFAAATWLLRPSGPLF